MVFNLLFQNLNGVLLFTVFLCLKIIVKNIMVAWISKYTAQPIFTSQVYAGGVDQPSRNMGATILDSSLVLYISSIDFLLRINHPFIEVLFNPYFFRFNNFLSHFDIRFLEVSFPFCYL
jgi:hypothetical protein